MKFPLRLAFLFSVSLVGTCAAHAQNETPPTPPEPQAPVETVEPVPQTPRPNPAYGLPHERVKPVGRHGEDRPAPRNADARKMAARKQAELERSVRAAMAANGFGDKELQNAILAHVVRESRARGPLRERARRLFRTMLKPASDKPDAMNAALADYLGALEADRARRIQAETALDARIGWTKNPRLHAMLLLFGVIGESAVTLPLRTFTDERQPRPRDGQRRDGERRDGQRRDGESDGQRRDGNEREAVEHEAIERAPKPPDVEAPPPNATPEYHDNAAANGQ